MKYEFLTIMMEDEQVRMSEEMDDLEKNIKRTKHEVQMMESHLAEMEQLRFEIAQFIESAGVVEDGSEIR